MAQSTLSKPVSRTQASLFTARWFFNQLEQAGVSTDLKVKTQQRGNTLHLLLEGSVCPAAVAVLEALLHSLSQPLVAGRLKLSTPPIYRVLVYGRSRGDRHAQWSQPLDPQQLDQVKHWLKQQRQTQQQAQVQHPIPHKAQPQNSAQPGSDPESLTAAALLASPFAPLAKALETPSSIPTPPERTPPEQIPAAHTPTAQTAKGVGSLRLSSRNRAQQGEPEAIARYLSEMLSDLGISVRVAVKSASSDGAVSLGDAQRLWVLCESSYSLDPAIVADWVVTHLRSLDLDGFQDAAVFSQVRGEPQPDWALRIDLTPKQELLRQWARWGDGEAIERLLEPVLQDLGGTVTVQAKQKALQIFCRATTQTPLDSNQVRGAIAPVLEELAPQGLHAATIYGCEGSGVEKPAVGDRHQWVEWLALPGADHPELAEPTLELAERGDLAAATFLLSRVLNADLDRQLQTGGIRVQLLRRGDLLHVMCDAPLCPRRKTVGRPIAKYIRQLRLPKVSGVRIYGRRAGQVQPRWQYGRDFVPRQTDGGDAVPQFAVTEARGHDLLTQDGAEIGAERSPWPMTRSLAGSGQGVGFGLKSFVENSRQLLLKTQLFAPAASLLPPLEDAAVPDPSRPGWFSPGKVALIWASLGLLAAVSTDLVGGQTLHHLTGTDPAVIDLAANPDALGDALLQKSETGSAFSSTKFTQGSLRAAQTQQVLALQREYPSFNNSLFDEKLALYRQRVMTEGPPDILILGSSRALRGIDPSTLAAGLTKLGHPDLKIFNFSINGSTAQVVELQLLLLLDPDYRPGLVLWADGARAFNSGRSDATYEAIQDSPAFRKLEKGKLPALFGEGVANQLRLAPEADGPKLSWLTQRFNSQDLDDWLDEQMGGLSSVHGQRDRIQEALSARFARSLSDLQKNAGLGPFNHAEMVPDAPEGEGIIDFDGFMSLSVRFNPATYYQRYSRVSGAYDGDYQDFRLDGGQMSALENIVQITRSQNIPLVFVNLPLTTDYLDPVRSRYERLFQRHMFQRMTQQQLTFRDLSQLWPDAFGNFSDPSHLNRYGARDVSNHLAEDPMIPWPQLVRN